VGVDDNGLASRVFKSVDEDVYQRAAKYRKKRFGSILGQRQQAGAQARCQDHRFHSGNGASTEG